MNSEQVNALNRVIAHYGPDDMKHFREAGEPSGHIARELMVLSDYMNHRQPAPPPNGDPAPEYSLGQAGSPIGIVRDHPSHDEGETSQGPSVIYRGSREIEVRWAKETIGLVANELNRAYTEIEITRDGHTIPGGLGSTAKRLNEAMQRLGVRNYDDLDSEIPF